MLFVNLPFMNKKKRRGHGYIGNFRANHRAQQNTDTNNIFRAVVNATK